MQGVCKNIVGCDSTVVCCIDDVIRRVVHDSVVAYLMTVKNRDGQVDSHPKAGQMTKMKTKKALLIELVSRITYSTGCCAASISAGLTNSPSIFFRFGKRRRISMRASSLVATSAYMGLPTNTTSLS